MSIGPLRLSRLGLIAALLAGASSCTPGAGAGEDAGPGPFGGSCDDDDPLTFRDWGGFCDDRVDDNCTFDVDPTPGCSLANTQAPHPCNTGDEPCPATLPGSAAPPWDCEGEPPPGVIARAHFTDSNEQVTSFCSYVYESAAVPDEYYVAIAWDNGPDVRGPQGKCLADTSARRYFFLSTLAAGDCGGVSYVHPAPVDEQPLSNRCRKAMRNLFMDLSLFDPDVQFFASSREEAEAKLAVLDTAEIACIGINNAQGQPYRDNEVWVVQAAAPLELVP